MLLCEIWFFRMTVLSDWSFVITAKLNAALSFFKTRKMPIMKKSWTAWSTYFLGMASSLASSSWKRSTWTARTLTPCSCFLRRNFPTPVITLRPWWTTPSSSSGVPCAGTTSRGTLRSSSSAPMGNHSSATAGTSWPVTLRLILKSCSRKWSKQS